jgi:hypothetical protein
VPKDFEDDLKFLEEWIEKTQLTEDYMVIEEENYSIIDTKTESIYDENTMDIGEEDTEIEEFFMKWSLEEINFYYELMLQQINDQKINGEEKTTKNGMWQQFTYKQFFEEKVEEDKKMKDKKLKHGIFSKRERHKLKMHRGFRIWKRKKRKTHSYMELKQILTFCLNCPL